MKQIRYFLTFAVFALALAAFAQQGPHGQKGEPHHGHMGQGMPSVDEHVQMLSEKLGLTDDQKSKIKTILEEHHEQMQAVMKDQSLSREDRRNKMRSMHDAIHSKVEALLNDDQKKKLAAVEQEMRQEHGAGHHHHDHGAKPQDESSPK